MTWAAKRRLQYLAGFFGFIFIILFIIFYPIIFKKPTCTDGKQNGTELGVDCGGTCSLMCRQQVNDPVVVWARGFHVLGSNYNLVAMVSNPNVNAGAKSASYEFRAYDDKNILIGRRTGTTFIPPNKQFAVFESRFDAGLANVKTVTFQFTDPISWYKREPTLNSLPLYVNGISLGTDPQNPSLSATIKNDSIYNLPSFGVTAVLYDSNGNAINASKTITNGLSSGASLPVYFTWPDKLSTTPLKEDVLVNINPFSVSF